MSTAEYWPICKKLNCVVKNIVLLTYFHNTKTNKIFLLKINFIPAKSIICGRNPSSKSSKSTLAINCCVEVLIYLIILHMQMQCFVSLFEITRATLEITCLNPGLQSAVIRGMCFWNSSRRLRIWFTTSRLSPCKHFRSFADPLHLVATN